MESWHFHNFNLMQEVLPSLTVMERVCYVILIGWGSKRSFAKALGVSHSGLNQCLSDPGKHPVVYGKLSGALGFDPLTSRPL